MRASSSGAAPLRCPARASMVLVSLACVLSAQAARAEGMPSVVTALPTRVSIGDDLRLCVTMWSELLADAKGAAIGLYLDDIWMADTPAEPLGDTDKAKDCTYVRFELRRSPGNKMAWTRLLGRPGVRDPVVTTAVGPQDPTKTIARGAQVEVVLWKGYKSLALALVSVALLALALFSFFSRNQLIRDDAWPTVGKPTFSLGRVQFALWIFQVSIAFLLLWGATGDADTLTPSILVLVGMSAATTLGSVLIGHSKEQADQAAHAAAAPPNAAPPAPPASQGFLNDILTDVNGYSLHRVQAAIWTVIVSILFWASIWRELAMPEFSEVLLGLMGISSGTYLFMKIPEKQS
jgi:hypothetical protein